VVAHRPEARLAVGRLEDPEALPREVEVDEIGDVGLVVDHDDRPLAVTGHRAHGRTISRPSGARATPVSDAFAARR
jgi:hypothetical protein